MFNFDDDTIELRKTKKSQAMALMTSMDTDEWYTPPEYLNLVREVIGPIDLDPCSSELANTLVEAKMFFSKDEDGLIAEWPNVKTVFMNPPYGKSGNDSLQNLWCTKLRKEFNSGNVENAIALVNANLGYDWFEKLYTSYPACLVTERIHFLTSALKPLGPSKKGSCFLLFTNDYQQTYQKFCRVFGTIGRVLHPNHGKTGPL